MHCDFKMVKRRSSDETRPRIMTRKFSLLKLGCKRESSQTKRKSHAKGHRSKRQPEANGTNSVDDGLMPARGDGLSVSNAQLPEHQPGEDQSAEDSWDSPDMPTSMLKGRSSGFEDYKSRLQMRDRCTVVACNDRGAQCVAVATAEERADGITMNASVPYKLCHLHTLAHQVWGMFCCAGHPV